MKIIKKLLLFILIIFVLYIVLLFAFTDKTKSIFDKFGLKNFNEIVLKLKGDLDNSSITNINYKDIQSGATQIINTTTDYAKEAKNKLDYVRKTANDVEEKYEEVKESVIEAKETLDKTTESLKEIQNGVEGVANIFN